MAKTIVKTTKTFVQIQDGNGDVREVETDDFFSCEEEDEILFNKEQQKLWGA